MPKILLVPAILVACVGFACGPLGPSRDVATPTPIIFPTAEPSLPSLGEATQVPPPHKGSTSTYPNTRAGTYRNAKPYRNARRPLRSNRHVGRIPNPYSNPFIHSYTNAYTQANSHSNDCPYIPTPRQAGIEMGDIGH